MNSFGKYRRSTVSGNGEDSFLNGSPVVTGNFVTKDQRLAVAQEVKKSHFILGSDAIDYRKKDDFNNLQANWKVQTLQLMPSIVHQSGKSHILIGKTQKFSGQSTQQVDFGQKSPDKLSALQALETKAELRRSHFRFGDALPQETFQTTNQEKTMAQGDHHFNETVKRMEGGKDSIVYGTDRVQYQSIMKDTMVPHSMQGQAEIRQSIKDKVRELRKHNYILGFDDQKDHLSVLPDLSKNQALQEAARTKSISQMKTQPKPVLNSQNIRKSHFEISHSKHSDFRSISRMAQMGLENLSQSQRNDLVKQKEQAHKTQQELRQSNFNLGRQIHSVLEENPTHLLLRPSEKFSAGLDKEKIQREMLKGHIVLGEEKNRSLKNARTSYKPATLSDQTESPLAKGDNQKHLIVSLHLGSHITDFVSETKQMFNAQFPQSHGKDPLIEQMKERIRGDNISFNDPGVAHNPALKTSMAHSQFDYKGNAMEIRPQLNPEDKKDLRQHHFSYGNHPLEYKNTPNRGSSLIGSGLLKPPIGPGAQPKTESHVNYPGTLRGPQNHGGSLFKGPTPAGNSPKGTQFQTVNQAFSKWIQPAPSKD